MMEEGREGRRGRDRWRGERERGRGMDEKTKGRVQLLFCLSGLISVLSSRIF